MGQNHPKKDLKDTKFELKVDEELSKALKEEIKPSNKNNLKLKNCKKLSKYNSERKIKKQLNIKDDKSFNNLKQKNEICLNHIIKLIDTIFSNNIIFQLKNNPNKTIYRSIFDIRNILKTEKDLNNNDYNIITCKTMDRIISSDFSGVVVNKNKIIKNNEIRNEKIQDEEDTDESESVEKIFFKNWDYANDDIFVREEKIKEKELDLDFCDEEKEKNNNKLKKNNEIKRNKTNVNKSKKNSTKIKKNKSLKKYEDFITDNNESNIKEINKYINDNNNKCLNKLSPDCVKNKNYIFNNKKIIKKSKTEDKIKIKNDNNKNFDNKNNNINKENISINTNLTNKHSEIINNEYLCNDSSKNNKNYKDDNIIKIGKKSDNKNDLFNMNEIKKKKNKKLINLKNRNYTQENKRYDLNSFNNDEIKKCSIINININSNNKKVNNINKSSNINLINNKTKININYESYSKINSNFIIKEKVNTSKNDINQKNVINVTNISTIKKNDNIYSSNNSIFNINKTNYPKGKRAKTPLIYIKKKNKKIKINKIVNNKNINKYGILRPTKLSQSELLITNSEKFDLKKNNRIYISKTPTNKIIKKPMLISKSEDKINLLNDEINKNRINKEINKINKIMKLIEKKIKSIEGRNKKNKQKNNVNNNSINIKIRAKRNLTPIAKIKKLNKKKNIGSEESFDKNNMKRNKDIELEKEQIEKERLEKEQKLKEKMEFKKSLELKEIENLEKENIQLSQKFQEIQKIIINHINKANNQKIFCKNFKSFRDKFVTNITDMYSKMNISVMDINENENLIQDNFKKINNNISKLLSRFNNFALILEKIGNEHQKTIEKKFGIIQENIYKKNSLNYNSNPNIKELLSNYNNIIKKYLKDLNKIIDELKEEEISYEKLKEEIENDIKDLKDKGKLFCDEVAKKEIEINKRLNKEKENYPNTGQMFLENSMLLNIRDSLSSKNIFSDNNDYFYGEKLLRKNWKEACYVYQDYDIHEINFELKAVCLNDNEYFSKGFIGLTLDKIINVLEFEIDGKKAPYRYDNSLIEFDIHLGNFESNQIHVKYKESENLTIFEKKERKLFKSDCYLLSEKLKGQNAIFTLIIKCDYEIIWFEKYYLAKIKENVYRWGGKVPTEGLKFLVKMSRKTAKFDFDITEGVESLNHLPLKDTTLTIHSHFIGGNNEISNIKTYSEQTKQIEYDKNNGKYILKFIETNSYYGEFNIKGTLINRCRGEWKCDLTKEQIEKEYPDDYKYNKEGFKNIANTIISNYDKLHEKEKIKVTDFVKIGEWIKDNIKYDPTYAGKNEITATEVYNNEAGVCHHFTKLYNAFLYSLGYECIYVSGFVIEKKDCFNDKDRHSWSLVKVNDKWLPFDPTWGIFSGKLPVCHIFEHYFSSGSSIKAVDTVKFRENKVEGIFIE